MFSGVSDGESPSESQNDVWVLRQDDVKDQIGSDSLLSDDSIPVTGVVIARPMCRPVVVPTPQYVLARVETHPTPSQVPNSMHQSLGSPMTSVGIPVSSCSPRKMPVMTTTTTTSTAVTTTMPFPRTCAVPPVRPPPPPPPPRTTPVVTGAGASSVRPPNPVLQRPSLQQRGNFHESPGAILGPFIMMSYKLDSRMTSHPHLSCLISCYTNNLLHILTQLYNLLPLLV